MTALEILREGRRHAARCTQCRLDAALCETARRYTDNFEVTYRRWDAAAREAAK